MRRRDLVLLAGAAALAPPVASAQQPERIRRIGYFTAASGSSQNAFGVEQTQALVAGLRELGWFDGRNISIEHRPSGTGRERVRATAGELIARAPEVIFSVGGPQLAALLEQTRIIPVVFVNVSDPVASGFIGSLAQPGGNATGIAVNEASLAGKWLELLKEIAPQIRRALVIMAADARPQEVLAAAAAAAAPSLELTLVKATVHEPADYERAMQAFAREPDGGVVALSTSILADSPARVHALAAKYRLPAVYSYPFYARTGGLISYGPDTAMMIREATRYIDKILRGARPGDLPVQQPTRFVLAVNLNTAKALGLTVPQSLLARADEVIE